MAYRDYILCADCGCKLIPDGNETVRQHLEENWGNPAAPFWTVGLLCPLCLDKLREDDTSTAEPIEWVEHTPFHKSTTVNGKRLDYWPSKKKFMYDGTVNVGDVEKFIREQKYHGSSD
jgi:hypothetical protein